MHFIPAYISLTSIGLLMLNIISCQTALVIIFICVILVNLIDYFNLKNYGDYY